MENAAESVQLGIFGDGFGSGFILVNLYLPIFTLVPVWFILVHVRLSHLPFCAA